MILKRLQREGILKYYQETRLSDMLVEGCCPHFSLFSTRQHIFEIFCISRNILVWVNLGLVPTLATAYNRRDKRQFLCLLRLLRTVCTAVLSSCKRFETVF